VNDPHAYPWHDSGFRPPEPRDLLLYQLHVGVFYAVDGAGRDRRRGVAKFLDLLDRLEYLRDLGVNGLQLLPVQEFPSETSEGYNGLDLFSPETDYHVADPAELARYRAKADALLAVHGQPPLPPAALVSGPDQLRCVVDLCHLCGIAVLFDLVFNHAGPGFNDPSLWFFDRQPPGDDNRSLYFTDQEWVGGRVFAYWKDEVRQFLVDNALACLAEYHADGIRYDEVSVIDDHGGRRLCRELSAAVRSSHPRAIQIAEYWKDDRAAAVRPTPQGLGFDAAWGDRLRDGVRRAIAQAAGGPQAAVDLGALAQSLETPDGFAPWQVVQCLENHDLVYAEHSHPLRLAALADPGDPRSWLARSRARVATGLLLAAPGIPMLFMGQESLAEKPWSDDVQFHAGLLLDWDGLESDPARRDHLRFCQDLLRLRRATPALRGDHLRVSTGNGLDRVLTLHRWLEGEDQDLLLVANLQEWNRFGYRIGFPGPGRWREVFNSDYYDRFPNPRVAGNGGAVTADGGPWDGLPASTEVTIPANGFVVFVR
jgi:1,4-alpha-glucan branching enzyme